VIVVHGKSELRLVWQSSPVLFFSPLFMSLIYTCQLNAANPFDYLTQLQRHADRVAGSPELWLPWNYRAAMT
jgi:hypothetical protein